jgi:hypothetical protein
VLFCSGLAGGLTIALANQNKTKKTSRLTLEAATAAKEKVKGRSPI